MRAPAALQTAEGFAKLDGLWRRCLLGLGGDLAALNRIHDGVRRDLEAIEF